MGLIARDLAVEIVDMVRGHTIEFSNQPTAHAIDYNEAEKIIERALAGHRGAVEALELIASRYDWDATACPKIAHEALVAMGLRPSITGGQ